MLASRPTRKPFLNCSVLFAMVLLLIAAVGAQEDIQNKKQEIQCRSNLPPLAIGDFVMKNAKDFKDFKLEHEIYILAVSDTKCEKCCQGEIILDELNELSKHDKILYDKQRIPIVRVDLQTYQGKPLVFFRNSTHNFYRKNC